MDQWTADHVQPILEKLQLNMPGVSEKVEPFENAFVHIFPEGVIDNQRIKELLAGGEEPSTGEKPNVYLLKVWLHQRCWRKILVSGAHTLQHLHQTIQDAFGLRDDYLFAFFMEGKPWSGEVYWDKREGSKPTAEKGVIGMLGLTTGQKFLYLFDLGRNGALPSKWKS